MIRDSNSSPSEGALPRVRTGLERAVPWLAWPAFIVTASVLGASPFVFAAGVAAGLFQWGAGTRLSRQPGLAVTAVVGGQKTNLVSGHQPWPIDIDRIVQNAVRDARGQAKALKEFSNIDSTLRLATGARRLSGPRNWSLFEKALEDYEEDLRSWLTDYRTAVADRTRTFELSFCVSNRRGTAHAEAVELVLELPPGSKVVENDADPVVAPPEPPNLYPRTSGGPFGDLFSLRNFEPLAPVRPSPRPWSSDDHPRTELRDVHMDRQVESKPICVRVTGPGVHVLRVRVYSKSLRTPRSTDVKLECLDDAAGPALGRIGGLVSYPDVPIEGEDSAHAPRTEDPPPPPPADNPTASIRDRITSRYQNGQWSALGLDPADDTGESIDESTS